MIKSKFYNERTHMPSEFTKISNKIGPKIVPLVASIGAEGLSLTRTQKVQSERQLTNHARTCYTADANSGDGVNQQW